MKMSKLSRALLILSGLFLFVSLFVPLWSIYLDAPQYPEGLRLQIWPNAIAGDVDIINGLNHYIGMKTLHTDDFIEFKILPYIISAFAIFFFIAAFISKKRWLYVAFYSFVAFGIIAMVDFWQWEYDYGHNLDPNAAIKVPGMAYQPPLIGFKQLLNFGAYSIPDIGGFLFLAAGLLLLFAVVKESGLMPFKKKALSGASTILLTVALTSCGQKGPEAILLHKDMCENCKMVISEGNFAAQVITQKGRVYKFDDLSCMLFYEAEYKDIKINQFYVGDYPQSNTQIDATQAFFVSSEDIRSPMGGNIAAFSDKVNAEKTATQLGTTIKSWDDVNASFSTKLENEQSH